MITYELALKLKEAGFPQGDWGSTGKYWSIYDGGASKTKPEIIDGSEVNFGFMEDVAYIPTISELIEACGEGFDSLDRMKDFKTGNTFCWATNLYKTVGGVGGYSTPEEAVANLYLEINKK